MSSDKNCVLFAVIFIFTMCARRASSENDYKLELVQVLFRHGARTPISEELNIYEYFDKSLYESLRLGALTNKGKKQAYDLGCFLRDRYHDFLSENYKPQEVYARSTHSERTKMSLQLVLAGLYPPTGREVWSADLKWSPVPYFYTPRELDILLRSYDRPEYLKIMTEAHQSNEFQTKIVAFSNFLKTITSKTGVNFENNFLNALMISGLIFSNEHMDLPLPDWYTADIKRAFLEIRQCFFDGYALTTAMKKFGTGPIIKTFVENMNLNGSTANPRKIYLYSAHDDNVASFARAHDVQDFRYPEFGSSLILEKWRDSRDDVFVRLLVWTPNEKLATLRLGNREEFCPIEDYLKVVESVVPTDDELDEFFRGAYYKDLKEVLFDDPEDSILFVRYHFDELYFTNAIPKLESMCAHYLRTQLELKTTNKMI